MSGLGGQIGYESKDGIRDRVINHMLKHKIPVDPSCGEFDPNGIEAHTAGAKPDHLIGATKYLDGAKDEMIDRASTYDSPDGEKSMTATVEAFNAIFRKSLLANPVMTEAMGWEFMSLVKKVRQFSRVKPHRDSAVDDVAYTALAAEARMNEDG